MARLPQSPPRSFREAVFHEELELRGVRARALQFPDGARDPRRAMVCVAGMGANGRSFVRQRPLGKDHLVLMLNLPSETPRGLDPLVFATEAVEEYIRHEALEAPVLLGSSFGGTVATIVALRRKVALRALILVSPVLARSQIPLAFPGFVDLLEAPRPIAALFTPAAAQVMGGFALDRDARDEIVREARHFTGPELKRRLWTLMHVDLLEAAKALAVPTLWVHGARDLLVPYKRARKAAAKIPAATFRLIRGAGHLPYLSHPAPFNELVRAFLARVDGESPGPLRH